MESPLAPTLAFLEALSLNNDRGWFEVHRKDYDRAREAVEGFVFRLDMEDGPRAFLAILGSPQFRARLKLLDGQKLRKVPKGFSEDHPAAELLKLKQVVAWRAFTDAEVLAPGFADEVVAAARALDPFLRYLEEAAGLVAPRE